MIRFFQAVVLSTVFAVACLVVHGGDLITSDKDRSPVDLVLSDTDSWLATANQTSNSVSLINIHDGELLDEAMIGEHPSGIVLHPSSGQLLVTSSYSGELYFLSVQDNRLKIESKIFLGFQPTGLSVSPDGKSIYVALTDADQVAVVDFASRRLVRKISVGRWPRTLAISNDGSRLAVGTSGDRGVSIVDAIDGRLLHIDQFIGLNIGHMQTSKRTDEVYFPWMVYRRNPINE